MAEHTTGPNQKDQQQKEAPASPPPSCTLFDTANTVLDILRTPFCQKQKEQLQQEEIRVLEEDLGILNTITNNNPSDHPSSPSSSSSSSSDTDTKEKEEEKEEDSEDSGEDDKFAMAATLSKKKSSSSSKQLTYKLGGMDIIFSNSSSNQNDAYNVGIVHPRASRPDAGTSAETKLIKALSKNQCPKFSKSESSLKDVTRLD